MPDLLVSTRRREVWTGDERRVIDRAAKLLNHRGVKLLLVCGSPVCPEPKLHLEGDRAGVSLRCGCTDRVFPPVNTPLGKRH